MLCPQNKAASLASLFQRLKLTEYLDNFIRQRVTVEDLHTLHDADLEKLIPEIGPRRRLEEFVRRSHELDREVKFDSDDFKPKLDKAPVIGTQRVRCCVCVCVTSQCAHMCDFVCPGSGSFGSVVKTAWRDTEVAVKTIRADLLAKKNLLDDFRNEINLVLSINHPRLVKVRVAFVVFVFVCVAYLFVICPFLVSRALCL